jgi:hypothetical protein
MDIINRMLSAILNFKLQQHLPELAIIALIIFYIYWYFEGRKKNLLLARTWIYHTRNLMQQQFALLGNEDGHLLLKDSDDEYIFYASGRRHCRCLYATLQVMLVKEFLRFNRIMITMIVDS